MSMAMYISISLTSANIILLVILTTIYIRNYLEIKAQFSLGLVTFAGILIVQKILTLYFMIDAMHDYADLLGFPLLVLESMQLFAFGILAFISIK